MNESKSEIVISDRILIQLARLDFNASATSFSDCIDNLIWRYKQMKETGKDVSPVGENYD